MAGHRYLTIIAWPEGWDRERVADHLAPAVGTDARTILSRLRPPPGILALLGDDQSVAGAMAMQEVGGDGFTCSLDDLAALGPTLKIKDLDVIDGTLEVQLWRGAPTRLDPSEIDVLVRVHLSSTQGRSSTPPPEFDGLASMQWGAGGSRGWAGRLHARRRYADFATSDRRVRISHKLDVHTRDGRVFQIDGDKFGFRVLGELRGGSDNVNIDRMCDLLVHLSPDIVVDPYFELWRPPPGYEALQLPLMQVNGDDPAFAFYSRWAAMMYRHVMWHA